LWCGPDMPLRPAAEPRRSTHRADRSSTVVGTLVNKATVDPTAIPWLLLSASPAHDSKPGRLDQTTFIQRVNTTGGLVPPASGMDARGRSLQGATEVSQGMEKQCLA